MLRESKFAFVKWMSHLFRNSVRIIDYRAAPTAELTTLRPARTIIWDRSRFTLVGEEPVWWPQESFELDASFRIELRDAEMIGKGVIVDREGCVVLESTIFQREYLRRSHLNHAIFFRKLRPAEEFDNVLALAGYLDMAFFHWMLDCIGRLELAKDLLGDESMKILIDENAPGFVRTSIAFLFGIDQQRIISGKGKRKRMKRCLLVSYPHTRHSDTGGIEVYPPELIHWLNTTARERLGTSGSASRDPEESKRVNIIISRRNAPGRRILNEDDLIRRYPALNFQAVALEKLSLREQIELFTRARVIIGVHGAGFTNLVYARDAAVIEFFPIGLPPKNTAYFFQIASVLGLDHLMVTYQPDNAPWDITLGDREFDAIDGFLRDRGII